MRIYKLRAFARFQRKERIGDVSLARAVQAAEDGLIAAAEEWLAQDRKQLAPVLSQRVAKERWDAKVEEISEIIEEALRKKRKG